MLLNLSELYAESLHKQISRQLTDKIVDGELSDGSELLPINVLARSQRVSKSTVHRAFESLENGGLIRDTGEIEFLKTTGPALGLSANDANKTQIVNTREGDGIIFYTDGVTETMNEKKEEYSEPRLLNLIKQIHHFDAQNIIQSLIKDLNKFQSSTYDQDDRTILMLKVF